MWDGTAEAVPLREDAIGVSLEQKPRKIQYDKANNRYHVTLKEDWLNQLEIGEQSAMTLHSFSMAVKPVIVQNPAIIIQPRGVLDIDE